MFVVLPSRLNPEVVHFATGQLFGAEARILIGFILGFSSPSEKNLKWLIAQISLLNTNKKMTWLSNGLDNLICSLTYLICT